MRAIDGDALIGELHTQFFYDGRDRTRVYAKVQEQPTIKPERKPGKWEPVVVFDGYVDFRCSACHRYRFHNGEMRKKYKYCPNCGAKMEGTE